MGLGDMSEDGDFDCPICHVKISPDDDSETVYLVLEVGDESITLQCLTCGTIIRIIIPAEMEDENAKT